VTFPNTGAGEPRSVCADNALDPRTQRLSGSDFVKESSSEAVLGLMRHGEQDVLGSHNWMTSHVGEAARLNKQFFDFA
jgi:hypothetical protein